MTTIQSPCHSKTAHMKTQSFDTIDNLIDQFSQMSKPFKFSFTKTIANQTSLSNTNDIPAKPNVITVNKNRCPYIVSKTVSSNTIIKTACGCHLATYSQYCDLHKSTKVNWEKLSEINAAKDASDHESSNKVTHSPLCGNGRKHLQQSNYHKPKYVHTSSTVKFKPNVKASRVNSQIVV